MPWGGGGSNRGKGRPGLKEKGDSSVTDLIYGFLIALKNEKDKERKAEKERSR